VRAKVVVRRPEHDGAVYLQQSLSVLVPALRTPGPDHPSLPFQPARIARLIEAAARKLIEIAKAGVSDPARLEALTVQAFQEQQHQPHIERKRG
jgi:hypothetical protein